MFKKVKESTHMIKAERIVTDEVLNQRLFSQRKDIVLFIDSEAGSKKMVLRFLLANLLPETELEKSSFIDREALFSIQGRRRSP